MIDSGVALALEIIDDISVIFVNWHKDGITSFHREIVARLNNAGLPIAQDKSIPIGSIEEESIPFIGNIISLTNKTVSPMTKSIGKLVAFFKKYDIGREVTYPVWASLAGKLVSYSMLNRGILAQFNYVYKHTPRPASKFAIKPAHIVFKVSERQKNRKCSPLYRCYP